MDKMDLLNSVPAMFAGFPGGGNPAYKTKDDWWAPPENVKFWMDPAPLEIVQDALFEKIPLIVAKYSGEIEARYKK
jgi:hypothetical protein